MASISENGVRFKYGRRQDYLHAQNLGLKTIIEDIGRDGAELMLSGFVPVCDDASPVKFLREDAIAMELRGLSRTHLVLDNDAQILGFFTLGVKCTRIRKKIA